MYLKRASKINGTFSSKGIVKISHTMNEQPIPTEYNRLENSLSKFCSQRKAIKEKGCSWIHVVKKWAVSKLHFWCWTILSRLFGFCFSLKSFENHRLLIWRNGFWLVCLNLLDVWSRGLEMIPMKNK